MALNKDGLEAGKPVDFETFKRLEREHREKANAKPEQRQGKEEVQQAGQRSDEGVSKPARKKAPKKSG